MWLKTEMVQLHYRQMYMEVVPKLAGSSVLSSDTAGVWDRYILYAFFIFRFLSSPTLSINILKAFSHDMALVATENIGVFNTCMGYRLFTASIIVGLRAQRDVIETQSVDHRWCATWLLKAPFRHSQCIHYRWDLRPLGIVNYQFLYRRQHVQFI